MLAIALATGALLLSAGSGFSGSNCTPLEQQTTGCASATTTDTEVLLNGSGGGPGSDGTDGGGLGASWPDDTAPVDPFAHCIYVLNLRCLVPGPGRAAEAQPVTLADIAAFRPAQVNGAMEPGGWSVVGLGTNFYASSAPQIHDGVLLGQPAAVRFTPVAFHWDYGDSSSAHLAIAGASWAALGVGEFDETATSHAYATSGEFTIRLIVDFAAEYRWGSQPWTPIAGSLAIAAEPMQVSVGTANTVLVPRDCAINPEDLGC